MNKNDTVLYFGERFKVCEVCDDNAVIRNDERGYYVPTSTLTLVEEAKEDKPVAKKKTAKK